jgi:sugar/nucleoside kinase (ribokinase family)
MVLNRKIHVRPGDLKTSEYPLPRLVHLDGRDLEACIKLANWARKIGAITAFDIGTVRNDVSPIFPLIDHLVVADSYALPFTGTRDPRRAIDNLRKLCPGTVVVTLGVDGQVGWENGEYVSHAAYKVASVDQTGAGDAFHAGYFYALLKGMPLAERLRYGSAVAAIKCTRPGGRDGLPTKRQLERFLKGNPKRYA